MGFFSWLTGDTERSICNIYSGRKTFPVYILIPNEFGGKYFKEEHYGGYGVFAGQDIYELVADWNREFLSKTPDFIIPSKNKKVSELEWYKLYSNLSLNKKDLEKEMKKLNECFEYRWIGIDIACYDQDNEALLNPIKITEFETNYLYAAPSKSCACQGYFYEDDWYEEMWDEDDEEC